MAPALRIPARRPLRHLDRVLAAPGQGAAGVDGAEVSALYVVLVALFLWAECLDCVGLRSLLRWWRT
jgi:hypothetical protein